MSVTTPNECDIRVKVTLTSPTSLHLQYEYTWACEQTSAEERSHTENDYARRKRLITPGASIPLQNCRAAHDAEIISSRRERLSGVTIAAAAEPCPRATRRDGENCDETHLFDGYTAGTSDRHHRHQPHRGGCGTSGTKRHRRQRLGPVARRTSSAAHNSRNCRFMPRVVITDITLMHYYRR